LGFAPGGGLFSGSIAVDGGAALLPPNASQPWWFEIMDSTGGSVGTITQFYVVNGGERYDGTNLSVPVPESARSTPISAPPWSG
jgi:hypothetical protein